MDTVSNGLMIRPLGYCAIFSCLRFLFSVFQFFKIMFIDRVFIDWFAMAMAYVRSCPNTFRTLSVSMERFC
jgi:hypothetical protein